MSPVERPPPQRVAIVVPVSTLAVLLGFALLVFLAVVSFGTLLSIFLAAVLAFGLDPPTSALVARGWGRGRAALVLFAALFVSVVALAIVAADPVWDQIGDFLNNQPQNWQENPQKPGLQSRISTGGADQPIEKAQQEAG